MKKIKSSKINTYQSAKIDPSIAKDTFEKCLLEGWNNFMDKIEKNQENRIGVIEIDYNSTKGK